METKDRITNRMAASRRSPLELFVSDCAAELTKGLVWDDSTARVDVGRLVCTALQPSGNYFPRSRCRSHRSQVARLEETSWTSCT
jgi:hypothetical protein